MKKEKDGKRARAKRIDPMGGKGNRRNEKDWGRERERERERERLGRRSRLYGRKRHRKFRERVRWIEREGESEGGGEESRETKWRGVDG